MTGESARRAADGRSTSPPGLELSLVVPTFNETANVEDLIGRVAKVLEGVTWEMIFVDDDSPDGTADLLHDIARGDMRIRCLRRVGRRGLSSACIEGMLASSAPLVAVLDADLQHDEELLSDMLAAMHDGDLDIVIGSRFLEGGGTGDWGRTRVSISRFAARLSRMFLRADLSDPMSGYFMIRREALHNAVRRCSGVGFKILLDLFGASPAPLRFREIPYHFRERHAGESKLDAAVAWEYLILLLHKMIGQVLPIRFISFGLVGAFGVLVHFVALTALFEGADLSFAVSQSAATLVAMTTNFLLNNVLTYSDMKLRGLGLLRGWILFTLACSVGALANVGISTFLFDFGIAWYLAAAVGVVVGAVWNYAVTSIFTWK